MSDAYAKALEHLRQQPKRWLVTGAAGFIGSNIVEALIVNEQTVIGLDNLATGHLRNLERFAGNQQFRLVEGDIRDLEICRRAADACDFILHQAGLGSVPRSLSDPITTNAVNVDGFLNMLVAARDAGVNSFVYAASSSTYGDHPGLPKKEDLIGKPLSPYAVTKYVNELYASVFARAYGLRTIGLRYFNIFGPYQDPNGAYAAVVPRWIEAMISGQTVWVNGDGTTSRDFTFVENAVQANILAATAPEKARDQVYNVAVGDRHSLLELFDELLAALISLGVCYEGELRFRQERAGDVRHSLADISKAQQLLGYEPEVTFSEGIRRTVGALLKQASISSRTMV